MKEKLIILFLSFYLSFCPLFSEAVQLNLENNKSAFSLERGSFQILSLPPSSPKSQTDSLPFYAPNQIIVKLKEGRKISDIQNILDKHGIKEIQKSFSETIDPRQKLEELKKQLSELNSFRNKWFQKLAQLLSKNFLFQTAQVSDFFRDSIAQVQDLESQIKAQEELIRKLEQRQKRALPGVLLPKLDKIYLLKLPSPKSDIFSLISEYQRNPAVEYATPNYLLRFSLDPTILYILANGLIKKLKLKRLGILPEVLHRL
jgi:hypothetical protein